MATTAGSAFLVQQRNAALVEEVLTSSAGRIQKQIESGLATRIQALERLALLWDAGKGMPRETWEAQVASIYRQFGGFQALEWADSNYTVRWVHPVEGNEQAVNLDLHTLPGRVTWLEQAKAEGSNRVTAFLDLAQGGKGFLVYVPICMPTCQSFFIGVFRLDNFFSTVVENSEYMFEVQSPNEIIFSTYPDISHAQSEYMRTAEIKTFGAIWTVRIFPTAPQVAALQSNLAVLILIFGLVVAISVGMLVRYYEVAKGRHNEILAQRESLVSSAKFSALGQMAAGIAHEINNPLTIILGYSQRLRTCINEDGIAPLENIQAAVKRIGAIVRGIKNASRDSSNDPMQTVDVSMVIADTLAFTQERFKSHQIALHVVPARDGLFIHCRQTEIAQILINLLSNAHDAIQNLNEKWVRLEVSLVNREIQMTVIDSGSGIPQAVQQKLMVPFFTTKAPGVGTGLGLSISRQIAEKHGGRLIYDGSHRNTTFVLILPAVEKPANAENSLGARAA